MGLVDRIKKLREDWKRIISVAKKPDKDMFYLNLRVTLIVLLFVGLLAFLVQLAFAILLG
ncbi:MAG: preprotein translocase subunit SecE [Metallosphaera yellowstonensis]|jgi:protein translocase subunit secE/sec61 gamma|uniref:Protein translocase subunit SecE n=1 Tax=Metallosphaera yellowstonensis MK1 TaxID=671065 RepID=H2C845_9CREN|nr:preprotein translocase subunit SecE [Metallosphaera yellowstonensis]EHP68321.1 preprotein translocase subunit Sss1 [Metallosphaera yellowstonensis MK1]